MSVFGPLLPSLKVERATKATLQLWLRDYLGEVAVQDGLVRGSLPLPRSWPTASRFGHVEDQTPAIGVHVPDLLEPPAKEPDGMYWCKYRLEVAVLISTATEVDTDRRAKLYTAAICGALVQNPSLGGVLEHLDWLTESYNVIDATKDRSIAAGLLTFEALLKDARAGYGGPGTPVNPPLPGDPGEPVDYGDWPTVSTVDVRLDGRTGDNP